MIFDPDQFPKYSLLSVLERFFLRSCCYFPPRPRRQPEPQDLRDLDKFTSIYKNAFGKELWSWIQAHTVIDLGCGEGGYVLALAAQGAKLALGLDIQSNFLHAQHKAQEDGLNNAAFLQAELAALKDNSLISLFLTILLNIFTIRKLF
jgi:2-polyprenyl-3-methyl-5-hydroxy-6-metoxy-1,4-benzoquinol methylase